MTSTSPSNTGPANTATSTDPSEAAASDASSQKSAPGVGDPRHDLAVTVVAVGPLIEAIEAMDAEVLTKQTPCPDFTVSDLLDHIVMVMRRVAVVGRGEHFSAVEQDSLEGGWAKAYQQAAHEIQDAWTEDQKLGQEFDVPWGRFPGAPILYSYTGELATHGWDLAVATGQTLEIADDDLRGAMEAARFIPAEGREQFPFGPVVDVGDDAPLLVELAAWFGHPVNDWT